MWFLYLSFYCLQSEQKWKQLAELAISKCQFGLAQECLHYAQDYGGLLLLATASGNTTMVGKLAEGAERDGKNNVAFMTYFLQGKWVSYGGGMWGGDIVFNRFWSHWLSATLCNLLMFFFCFQTWSVSGAPDQNKPTTWSCLPGSYLSSQSGIPCGHLMARESG